MKIGVVVCICLMSLTSFGQEGTVTKLTFEEAVKIGLKKNVLLNQQKNQLLGSQAQKLNSIGNFMPNLNITGGWQHVSGQQQTTNGGDLEDTNSDQVFGQLNSSLNIFGGLRNINLYSQANNQLMAQSYLIKRGTQDVVSVVANQYLQVVLDQELMKIAEENLHTQQTLKDQMQGFFDVGSRAATDLYSQDALMKAAEVTFIRAKSTLVNDRALLAQTLQLDPAQSFEVIYPVLKEETMNSYETVTLDSLIQIAIANRSDLKQTNHQVSANRYSMRATSAGYMPQISLYANYGSFWYSLIPENFSMQFKTVNPSLTYGANVTIPIFSRFLVKSQHVTAKIAYENSVLTKDNLEKTVKLEVQRSYYNLKNAMDAYKSSLAQFEAGDLALRTQKESYELGASDQVALAQATQTYVLGAASKAQAEVTLLFQRILLEYALGTIKVEDIVKD